MRARVVVMVAGAVGTLLGIRVAGVAQTVQPCTNPDNCVQVGLTNVGTDTGKPGDTVKVGVTFKQAPATLDTGGADKIAALAMTIMQSGGGIGTPLALSDCSFACLGGGNDGGSCTQDSDCPDGQCMVGAVKPQAALAGFKAVVENASCAGGRTHCLCPDAGQTRDNFINLVVYGPNPLPTQGPIDIQKLPEGELVEIGLSIQSGANGNVTLHALNEAADAAQRPQFTALLSVGDKTAVDQTCLPLAVPGTAPCAAAASTSQVAVTDATIKVNGAVTACACDCDTNGRTSGSEITKAVLILGGARPLTDCGPADSNHDGRVSGSDITRGVLALGAGTACVPQ